MLKSNEGERVGKVMWSRIRSSITNELLLEGIELIYSSHLSSTHSKPPFVHHCLLLFTRLLFELAKHRQDVFLDELRPARSEIVEEFLWMTARRQAHKELVETEARDARPMDVRIGQLFVGQVALVVESLRVAQVPHGGHHLAEVARSLRHVVVPQSLVVEVLAAHVETHEQLLLRRLVLEKGLAGLEVLEGGCEVVVRLR